MNCLSCLSLATWQNNKRAPEVILLRLGRRVPRTAISVGPIRRLPPRTFGIAIALRHSYSLPEHTYSMPKLYTPRDAAQVLGISYASLKQWIYQGKLKSVQTPGGHHRIPESEIDRMLPRVTVKGTPEKRRRTFRRISGRNQLVGRVTDVKVSGLLAQVTLSIGGQHVTSIITADAVRELRLKKGQIAAALIKSTEVMIILPD
jgi:molybdopterin-binding protein